MKTTNYDENIFLQRENIYCIFVQEYSEQTPKVTNHPEATVFDIQRQEFAFAVIQICPKILHEKFVVTPRKYDETKVEI